MKENEKMKRSEKFIFAAGDIFGGGAQLIVSFYYLIFLTDIIKLRPALAGLVILISKSLDAIADPLMGVITDNTRTRWGRRKPYLFIGAFAVIASFFLLWYPISNDSTWVKFAYVMFSYMLYSLVSTMLMVPYAAMSSEISKDYKERSTVNGMRLFFSQFSSLLCAVLPLEIIKLFPDEKSGYVAMALCFGVLFAIPFLLIFFFAKERVEISSEKSKFDVKDFILPFKIHSFRILIIIYLFAFLSMDVVSTVFAYYMNYYLKRPSELDYVLGAMLITQIIMVPLVIKLMDLVGKAKTMMLSILVWGIGIVFIALLKPDWPTWAIYVNAVVMGLGMIGCIVTPWVMYPDVTDVGEFALGKRNAGSFGGIMSFMRKLSSAVCIFIVSNILDIAGYIKPVETVVGGATAKTLMEQPAAVIFALKAIVVGFPFVLLFFTFFMARKYPITEAVHKMLAMHLEFIRGNVKEPPLPESEVEQLRKTLV